MAIQTMIFDPGATSYANLADLDSVAAAKLAGIEDGAEVNPSDLADLDAAAATKLSGVEVGATTDQTAEEIRDAVVGIPDVDRQIVITKPVTGEYKVTSVARQVDGQLKVDYDDTPVP